MVTVSKYAMISGLQYGKPQMYNALMWKKYSSPGTTKPVNGKFVKPLRYTAIVDDFYNRPAMELYHHFLGDNYRPWALTSEFATDYYSSHRSVDNLINRALVGAGNRKMTLGETLAESRSTFYMISRNCRSIAEMFRCLKRGHVIAAARALGIGTSGWRNVGRDASNKYLEMLFGWKPLIDEVYNGVDVIREGLSNPYDNPWVVGYANDKFTMKRPDENLSRWPLSNAHCVSEFNAECKLTFKFNHPSAGRAMNQLGLLNPVSLAWNLLPMSFVFDWFIPVGTFLDGFTATEGLTYQDGYTTQWVRHTHKANAEPDQPSRYFLALPYAYDKVITQRRIVDWAFPRVPDFELPNSIEQARVAAALLWQRGRW